MAGRLGRMLGATMLPSQRAAGHVRLGYVPGFHTGTYHVLQRRLFGTRRYSREVEYWILQRWLPDIGRALDVACGAGDFSWALALRGNRVVALDRDREALRIARGMLPHAPAVALVEGDALALPFVDASFDLCFCNSSVEHFADEAAGLAEMARVLKPGGRLLLTTDAFPAHLTRLAACLPERWLKPELRGPDRHGRAQAHHRREHHVVRYFTPEVLASRLKQAGLAVECVFDPTSRAPFPGSCTNYTSCSTASLSITGQASACTRSGPCSHASTPTGGGLRRGGGSTEAGE